MYINKYKLFFNDEDLNLLKNILDNNNNNNKNALKIKKILIPLKTRDLYYEDLVQLLDAINENTCIYYEFYEFQCYINADKFTHFKLSKINNFIEKYKWYDLTFEEIKISIFNGNLKINDFKKIKKIIYKPIKYYRDFIKLRDILLNCLYDSKKFKFLQRKIIKSYKLINNIIIFLNYVNLKIFIFYGNIWLKRLNEFEIYYLNDIFIRNKIDYLDIKQNKCIRLLYLNFNLKFMLIKNVNKTYKYTNLYNYADFLKTLIDEIDYNDEYIYKGFEPYKYVNLIYFENYINLDFSTSSENDTDYSDDNELNYNIILKNNYFFWKIKLNFNYIKLFLIYKNNNFFFNIYNLKYFIINESWYDNIEDNYIYCIEKYILEYKNYPVYSEEYFDLINTFGIHMEYKFILGNKGFIDLIWKKIWLNNNLTIKIKNHAISWSYDWEDNLYWYRDSYEFNYDLINKFYFYKIKLNEKIIYIDIYKQKIVEKYLNNLIKNNSINNIFLIYTDFIKIKIKKNIFYIGNYIYLLNIYNLYYISNLIKIFLNKNKKIIFFKNKVFRKNKYIISCILFWKFYTIMLCFILLYLKNNNYIYIYINNF